MILIGYTENYSMVIRTSHDLGALIRDRRTKMGLDQLSVAKRAGTSRKWLVEMEKGKPRAAIGLILRTLRVLDINLEVNGSTRHRRRKVSPSSIDIDQHLDNLRKES
jgi:HTH-type transcriptional regulator / antitoxin HipB